jgi:transcriptional regulator with XRE-family HTH domain
MQRFGEKLRTLRKRHGLTQQQLGEQFGLSKGFIKNLEYGYRKLSIPYLLKMSDFFGVPADVLIRDELDLDVDDEPS